MSSCWRSFAFVVVAAVPVALVAPREDGTDDGARGRAAGRSAEPPIRYGRDIRPLLSDRCFSCHGPDENKRKAKLRLDEFEGATAERPNGPAIVAGDVVASELVHRIEDENPKRRMPPPSANKPPLTPEEQARVRRWIEQGAQYEPHWAFVPPVRPPVPGVRAAGWCANDVDRFVVAKLEAEGIEPGPLADRESLLRRVFLDLTGLPPTPEELDAFLADARPDAYERAVDRLFAEEPYRTRYAERMAVPWLDAARYADTCGIHTDAGRQIWPWRDWVLGAFRENMPFDRFILEQIAGDLLPDATEAQKVASGFNRNHVTTDEGGAISEEYLVEYAVDRASTTGSVFLALTLGCARCHEHKFDPISQDEFYGVYSYFGSIEEPGLYSQLPDPNRAFEPFMKVPTPEQRSELKRLDAEIARAKSELETTTPEELAQRERFLAELPEKSGLAWASSVLVRASSSGGARLVSQPDGSLLVRGENPAQDEHEIVLRTDARDLRLLLLEALADPSLPEGRTGRAPNGNAVLTGVSLEVISVADRSQRRHVRFGWAVADHEQENGDHRVVNVLDPSDDLGWAVDSHRKPGGRVALLLADEPFGFEGGSEVRVALQYRSPYAQHVLGRVRVSLGTLAATAFDQLATAASGWYVVGPFASNDRNAVYDERFGPEDDLALDRTRNFGAGNQAWRYDFNLADGRENALANGVNASYVGRRLFAPTARKLELSLGSDDGVRLFVNGVEAHGNRVDRGLAPDQDQAAIELSAGANVIVFKVVNTGGASGFYWRAKPREGELAGDLFAALLPPNARSPELESRLERAWKITFSPGYRERREQLAALEKRRVELDASVPRTMVMQELPAPRETYVLMRGEYDKPDKSRPVRRGIPAALGKLPEGAPDNRLGLAQWLIAPENPLVARVAVNRWWEMLFGTGIVATTEDFGLQGEWPSHPELLDWLAMELIEGGAASGRWNVQHLLKLLVTSSTYKQSARARPDVRERDAANRLLSWFPRRRLGAEQIRDQALFVAGLLIEQLGGPSVKPYQPDGLWQEVAMPASNTRFFTRGQGEELWRRSLYTYWKRACPPPSLQTFDAPTREFCTIRRTATNTPLQALVLWNDEQFVEAARVLAQRTLAEPGDDASRLVTLVRRCTGRGPDDAMLALLSEKLVAFRRRYESAPADAEKLVKVGMAPVSQEVPLAELAAWTLIANAVLNLDATVCGS